MTEVSDYLGNIPTHQQAAMLEAAIETELPGRKARNSTNGCNKP